MPKKSIKKEKVEKAKEEKRKDEKMATQRLTQMFTVAAPLLEEPPREEKTRDPKVEQLKYYHYRIHRIDIDPMLKKNGDFVLRSMRAGSDGHETYVVSVRWDGIMKHFQVQTVPTKDGPRFCFEHKCFKNLKSLVQFHMENGEPLTTVSGARLERPKDREPWELLSHQLETKKKLGKGAFGTVSEAVLTKTDKTKQDVAVKSLDRLAMETDEEKLDAARIEVLAEARILRDLSGHQNIVGALGVTIDREQPVTVMELVRGASLDKLLRTDQLTMDTKLTLGYEAATGIKYIHAKGYLHRDIAARNCLVEVRHEKICRLKVTDFGLAKFVGDKNEYKQTVKQMPVSWSAYESLHDYIWTRESDVWSFGVLMWEIFDEGSMPYNEFESFDQATALAFLKSGKRLEFPPDVKGSVADAVKQCWHIKPAKRPSLSVLQDSLKRAMKKK